MRIVLFKTFLFIIVGTCCISCGSDPKPLLTSWKIEDGYVPNEASAKKIAEVVWVNVYGADVINNERPFKARLVSNKVWIVEGTLKSQIGGVAYIEIQKCDGKILKVIHGK